MTEHHYDPRSHYDVVTDAWTLLLGQDLHYGIFAADDEPLEVATARLTTAMIDVARLSAGQSVLDVGCGTGHAACRLAAEQAVTVLGITPSPVGVDRATARARELGLDDRARFEIRDGMDNGLPAERFDRVWVLESSHLMRHRDRLVAECARVVVPGGRVVLCDLMLRRPMPFDEVRRLRAPLAILREAFGNAHLQQLSDYEQLFRDNGLDIDASQDLTKATRLTFARWRENAEHHRDAVTAEIGQRGLDAFVASIGVLEGFWDDGTIGYGLLAGAKPD